jgi:hypothetical protein
VQLVDAQQPLDRVAGFVEVLLVCQTERLPVQVFGVPLEGLNRDVVSVAAAARLQRVP